MIKKVTDLNGNRHEIYIDTDLDWLSPYLTVAKRLGVPVWRIREIKGYQVPFDKLEQQEAATIKDANKKMVITILKNHQVWVNKKGKFEVSHYVAADESFYFEHTMDSLAHELSHIIYWDHSADRFIFEKKLLYSFACLAKKRGYRGYDG